MYMSAADHATASYTIVAAITPNLSAPRHEKKVPRTFHWSSLSVSGPLANHMSNILVEVSPCSAAYMSE